MLNTSYSWNDYFDYIPCTIKEFKEEFYFTSIKKNAGIDSTLLGAKIIEIEGIPAIRYIEEVYFPYISASTLEHKFFQTTGKIGQGLEGTYFKGKAYTTYKPDTVYVEKSFKRIDCPVVVLISIFSFSACEDFLVNIYELPHRPLLIGEKTGGSTGAPLLLSNLPNETRARVCTLRILFPYSMKQFVGMGISPDIEIKEAIEDYINGEDVVLNRALQTLTTNLLTVSD